MQPAEISRQFARIATVAVATDKANSDEINYRGFPGGSVILPTGQTLGTLSWFGSDQPGGTFVPVLDSTGTAVTQTTSTIPGGYPIPAACFGYAVLKIQGDVAGSVIVTLKG